MIKATRPRERSLKDKADIKAILHNTKVNLTKILKEAGKETTGDLALSLLANEQLRKRAPEGWGSTQVIRYWGNRRS